MKMMLQSTVPPFTYVEDSSGLIFYSHGIGDRLAGSPLRVTMVYHPAGYGAGRHYQHATGRHYVKFVCHGYSSETPRMKAQLPSATFETLSAMFQVDEVTGEQFLGLEASRIVRVYSPKDSLAELMQGKVPGFNRQSVAKLHEAVGAFVDRGIGLERLGLYGGLQCLLVREGLVAINDIDVLVEGLASYPTVVALCERNVVRPETFPAFVANDPVKKAVALRRGQLSQFRLASGSDTVVDIRITRVPGDPVSHPPITAETLAVGDQVELPDMLVTNAAESLSIPAGYVLQNKTGTEFTVSTPYYHSLGAAFEGDRVLVKGILIEGNAILLLDPDHHSIHVPS